ncbi:MAG TPA: amidohydrolase, partial [Xanthomonadales bacterium]|nr:amidohydrolase [Xanthomonadales bacterium]
DQPQPESAPDPESAAAIEPDAGQVTLAFNGLIYTFDPGNTVVEGGALAISADGEILAIGNDEPMKAAYADAVQHDLQGRAVFPGLIDAHAHFIGLASSLTQADLVGTESIDEVIARLQEFETTLDDDDWLVGRGWDQNDWPGQQFPSRADLDTAFPERVVWLERIDGHAGWANSAALAQVDRDLGGDWQPQGGKIHRDAQGQATGIFIDVATRMLDELVPPVSAERLQAAIDQATETLLSLGLTGVHDAGLSWNQIQLLKTRADEGRLGVRVYAMTDGVSEAMEQLCANGYLEHPSGRLLARSVKLYADGALGSRGAALLEDYSDEPGSRGLLFISDEEMQAAVRRAMECNLQVGVHAIGDGGNRQVLDAFAAAMPDYPDNPGRHRMEHSQVIALEDIPRFADMDIIASVQPIHATSDMYWAEERVGPDRILGAYAWRRLLDAGVRLALGSDFPVEQVNPMLGIYAAVSRQDLQGQPQGGWYPDQALTRAEAIRGFTVDAAWAAFMENDVGSIEAGKRADFIVLDRDLMTVDAHEIADTQVLETWLDGKLVWKLPD